MTPLDFGRLAGRCLIFFSEAKLSQRSAGTSTGPEPGMGNIAP